MQFSDQQPFNSSSDISKQVIPFPAFLDSFEQSLTETFRKREKIDKLSIHRGLPSDIQNVIMSTNPLSVNIPVEYGGRGGHLYEILSVLSASAYESLPLALTFAINGALFLQPFAKYGQVEVKKDVFRRFIENQAMGGLMITEPEHGSDALRMNTSYFESNGRYHLKGTKHWAGLTGKADFWLLTARKKDTNGNLLRDIDFFLCDVSQDEQKIVVEEYFESLGLYQIPYGRNIIDLKVPLNHRLIPESTGIYMMLDILHRSRLHISGVGLGFIGRMLDEAIEHSRQRKIGGMSLIEYDQVQARISRMQAGYTICSAFCTQASELSINNKDLAPFRLEANVIKTVVSDLMQESSQSLLQLVGAKGYKLDHIAGRSTTDSRPFQIFEGSNDILYHQIAESILGSMKKLKEYNFLTLLRNLFSSTQVAEPIKEKVNFTVDKNMPQRKLVEFGKLVSRIVTMDSVMQLADKNYRNDLIANAVENLQHEIAGFLSSFTAKNQSTVIENYREGSNWMSCLNP